MQLSRIGPTDLTVSHIGHHTLLAEVGSPKARHIEVNGKKPAPASSLNEVGTGLYVESLLVPTVATDDKRTK